MCQLPAFVDFVDASFLPFFKDFLAMIAPLGKGDE